MTIIYQILTNSIEYLPNLTTPPQGRFYKEAIIISKRLKLNDPGDVRNLIKSWLRDVAATGTLPFENGGTVVQLLNTWLKAYVVEKIEDIEKRLSELEKECKEPRR